MKAIKYLGVLCLLLSISKPCFSVLKLAAALQSNMVLQQNKAFKVWGTAGAEEKIFIWADWMEHPLTIISAKQGNFSGIIEVPKAKKGDFKPHAISVRTQSEKLTLNNLLIGDLWFCSGQSNMQFAVKDMIGAEEVIKEADQPHIRLLNVGLNFSATPVESFSGKWEECSPESVKNFSAIGYTFGKKLCDELNIPIGMIFSGIGASGVQAYLPQEELATNELLNKTYLKPYLESSKSREDINGSFSFEKVVRPFLLYNALINPFVNLSIKGFCWYQGEANHLERESYVLATQTMIRSWRDRFRQGDLPFYYVQIAPYFHEKEDDKLTYDAFFREAQEKITELSNTEMVSTMDVGDAKDLHPKNKRPVGLRLAAVALNRTYTHHNLVYKGPEYDYSEFKKSQIIIHFKPETLGSGLNTNDGKSPKHFYVAGNDRVYHRAIATFEGNTVVVTCKKVRYPVAVRYAFFNYPVTNLQNKEGFPVLPFRTDSWAEVR